MLALRYGKPVRHRVSIVRLEGDQRRGSDREVVEINLRNKLWKSRCGIGNDAKSPDAGHETERRQRRLATARVVQVRSGTEEGSARLVHRRGADGLIVADNELLRASWRYRGEAGNACATVGQGAVHGRVVKVVIKRPVARLAIVKVDPLPDLVVRNPILLPI